MCPVPTLLITGTIGSGKTSVAIAIGEILSERGEANAGVDLDWLGWVHLPDGDDGTILELIARNLTAIWPNLRTAGVRRVVLVRALRAQEELETLRRAVPDAEITVVRLAAKAAVIEQRLRRRDSGKELEELLDQTAAFAEALDRAALEDVTVSNEYRQVELVAADVLRSAGWFDAQARP